MLALLYLHTEEKKSEPKMEPCSKHKHTGI